jgi:hypothetical protein
VWQSNSMCLRAVWEENGRFCPVMDDIWSTSFTINTAKHSLMPNRLRLKFELWLP